MHWTSVSVGLRIAVGIPVRIAVLTVSDTRDMADDRSGDTLVCRLEEAGHILAARAIVRDLGFTAAVAQRPWLLQMLEVARSRRMCCSRVARVRTKPRLPSTSTV